MIGELAFKGFCAHAKNGLPIRALFITPDKAALNEQKLGMINEAAEHKLDTLYVQSSRSFQVANATAYLRIAHPYLDRELRDLEWHFIHGLEYVERLENGDVIAVSLEAMARL